MNRPPLYTTLAVAFLTWLLLVGCLCGSGDDGGSSDVDDRFVNDAKANGWYLGVGSFTQLWDMFDYYCFPQTGETPPVDLLDAHHWGSWDLSKDNLIVAESGDFDPATQDTPHLMVLDLDLNIVWEDETKKHFQLYSDYRWSPDGTMISYAHGTEIFIIDWATKETRAIVADHKPVVRDGPLYATPSWGPDSKRLAYQTTEDEVAIVDVNTKKKEFLGKGEVPTWSPDGKTIACLKTEHYTRKKMLAYDPATKKQRVLFESEWSLEGQPVWTPDSKYLLFRRPLVNSIYGELYFFVIADGKVFSTGRKLAAIRNAQVVKLPESYRSKLSVKKDTDTENPNRRPR